MSLALSALHIINAFSLGWFKDSKVLLCWGKLKWLQYPRLHGFDQWYSVGNDIIPFWIMPSGFSASFAVSHGFVTPDNTSIKHRTQQ